MSNARAALRAIARQAMLERGFEPDYSPAAAAQVQQLSERSLPAADRRDLRHLLWCSIDNEDSRDLDQLSVAEVRGSDTAILVAIADVDAMVPCDSAVDRHALANTWLEGQASPPPKLAAVDGLADNLRRQDAASRALKDSRHRRGALTLETIEGQAVFDGDTVRDVTAQSRTRAAELIEDFMIAVNTCRFADLVTQRLIKAALTRQNAPYSHEALATIAARCMDREDAANRVERQVKKAAAAMVLEHRVGELFDAVVTGASPKGTWVRLRRPIVEGKLERGHEGRQVGDRLRVKLIHVDPPKGFIDFAAAHG